ncbi:MAG: DUF2007 domain-containing protein [Gemmatimonadetes bacterium]|nr:DUF2007 domain-containing protein [Gemmatimonadota bacterium]
MHAEAVTGSGCAICGLPVCGECDRGDRHASICERHEDVRVVEGWAEVRQTSGDAEAQLVVDALRAADLDAHVLSQKDHAHMLSVAGMAVVRVLVPAGQYEPAVRALASVSGDASGG